MRVGPVLLPASLVAALLAATQALAGSAQQPEVVDAAGDVAASGVPLPAGAGWADIRAAWFQLEEGNVTLTIQVEEGAVAPPAGEVGLTFLAGRQHYIAGYTVVPGFYSGGFLSKSDADGDVGESDSPMATPGTFEGGTITVRFALGDLEDAGNLTSFSGPWGWSEAFATNGETYRMDRTDVGLDFAWMPPQTESYDATGTWEPKTSPVPLPLAALGMACLAARGRR